MKQVIQRLRDGKVEVIDVPPPALTPDGVLVDVRASLISAGTERSKLETGRQSLLGKARARPDQARQVIEKAQRDGLRETVRAVRSRLDAPSALGYSSAGVVLAVGARVRDVAPGDRVACGGGDYAVHADVDHVPANLCVLLPDAVGFEAGAFATVGAIALQGMRQADVRLGERVGVIGLGLVGQLTGQLLRAAGCEVVGVDLDAALLDKALALGSADAVHQPGDLSERVASAVDCDAVIITAATQSDDPVRLAATLCRDRGTVVVVGDVGLELPRAPYYDKELQLRLSRSYGPGRYDREYEERGLDYPLGYVRWTERRNMEAFLAVAARGGLRLEGLVSDRQDVNDAARAYERLVTSESSPLAVVLTYAESTLASAPQAPDQVASGVAVGVLGAGSFATGTVIPALAGAGFRLAAVASATGRTASAARDRAGFARVVAPDELLADPELAVVAIVTRHSTHADYAERALRAGKWVFVEKPPCLTVNELERLRDAQAESGRPLVVGFNRRHAPLARTLRNAVRRPGQRFELLCRVNAGVLARDHWLNDLDDGGGRLLGEGCHFVDFACWFADALPVRVTCSLRAAAGQPLAAAQAFTVALDFADGSLATVVYGAEGSGSLAKERFEAHSGGRSAVLDDFVSVTTYGCRARRGRPQPRDKGHTAQFAALHALVGRGVPMEGPSPLETMAVTLAALRSAETGQAVSLRASPSASSEA